MLRTAIFAAALLAASISTSTSASARNGDHFQARVISVAPQVALSFGSLRHDGFRVEYTHHHRRSGQTIFVPAPFPVVQLIPQPVFQSDHWRNDERRGWRGHEHRDNRRQWRDDDREGKYGRQNSRDQHDDRGDRDYRSHGRHSGQR